jgi:hypothetical protein
MTCFAAALAYLDRGWAVLALCPPHHRGVNDFHRETCQHPGKRPLGRWKQWQARLPTKEELTDQWGCVPDANVGVILGSVSRMVGIDIDGPLGSQLLDEISDGDLPETLAFSTSRGMRLLYRIEPGAVLKTWAHRRDGSEVKVLGEGSLTVMPPSRHVSGHRYRWGHGRGPGQTPLAPAPRWVTKPKPPMRSIRISTAAVAGAAILEGERNERLFKIACGLRRHGCEFEEIVHALIFVNDRRCKPPLQKEDIHAISRSAAHYAPAP